MTEIGWIGDKAERYTDAVWGWAAERVRWKYDPFWIITWAAYRIGNVFDRG